MHIFWDSEFVCKYMEKKKIIIIIEKSKLFYYLPEERIELGTSVV